MPDGRAAVVHRHVARSKTRASNDGSVPEQVLPSVSHVIVGLHSLELVVLGQHGRLTGAV